eukprot:4040018-Alexandrium_andersonii.AAC.1
MLACATTTAVRARSQRGHLDLQIPPHAVPGWYLQLALALRRSAQGVPWCLCARLGEARPKVEGAEA